LEFAPWGIQEHLLDSKFRAPAKEYDGDGGYQTCAHRLKVLNLFGSARVPVKQGADSSADDSGLAFLIISGEHIQAARQRANAHRLAKWAYMSQLNGFEDHRLSS
jgi:hypothetical protein